jgi:hypothetical protein
VLGDRRLQLTTSPNGRATAAANTRPTAELALLRRAKPPPRLTTMASRYPNSKAHLCRSGVVRVQNLVLKWSRRLDAEKGTALRLVGEKRQSELHSQPSGRDDGPGPTYAHGGGSPRSLSEGPGRGPAPRAGAERGAGSRDRRAGGGGRHGVDVGLHLPRPGPGRRRAHGRDGNGLGPERAVPTPARTAAVPLPPRRGQQRHLGPPPGADAAGG